jgi:predicted acyl esterase
VDPAAMDPCRDYPNMSYVSDVLASPLYVAGSPRADLRITTTAEDADVSVLLYEYNTANQPALRYISFGTTRAGSIGRVNPDEPMSVPVEMHSLAHEFQAGSRIAISITGSLCGYAENPHTGEAPDRQTEWRRASYRIHHGRALPSRLVLPVLR